MDRPEPEDVAGSLEDQGTWGIVNTAAIGAIYAGVFLWRRSLWAPTAAHMAFNAIVILRG